MADANTPPPSPPPVDLQGTSIVSNPPATPARTDGTGFPPHGPQPFNSTPLKPSQNPWLVNPEAGKARRISLVDDTGMGTRFHQLGLNTFNSIVPGDLPSSEVREQFFTPDLRNKKMSEHDIGVELSKTINSILNAAETDCGLEALFTAYHKSRGDHGNKEDTCNDIGIYPTTEVAQRITHFIKRDFSNSRYTKGHLEEGSFGRRSWYWMAVLGEIKSDSNRTCAFKMVPSALLPPQTQDTEQYIAGNEHGEEGLGQLAEYMHNFLTHQHRCFVYGFYVQWKYARLLYFDRTGALLSEAFEWSEPTSLLHDFVWKIAHMTPEQLGYDPTAQVASQSHVDLIRSKIGGGLEALPAEVQQYVRNAFDCTTTRPPEATTTTDTEDSTAKGKKAAKAKPDVPLDEIPIYKLTVTSSDPSPDEAFPNSPALSVSTTPSTGNGSTISERDFLVGRPYFAAGSLTGRCTRGYIAFDIDNDTFCFLKDSWRPLFPGRSRPEHLVYERLRNHNVSDIASLVCGGDVGGHRAQVTRIQEYMPPEKKPVPRIHYRIVVKEIGLPLTEFKTFTELAGIFGDALGAHLAAYDLAGILHRDVSVGNILINPETRSGFLIDWDLSRLVSELEQGAMEPDRTGTWQFRSALSLYYLRKPYKLSDDIESFVHAFQYMVLRFHRTGLKVLRSHVQSYFEQSAKAGPFRVGGQLKLTLFRSPQAPFNVEGNNKLQALLDEIARRCHHEFYKFVDEGLMERRYGIEAGVARAPNPPTQVEQELAAPPRRRHRTANNQAMMAKFQHLDTASSSSGPSFPKRDACDIQNGILAHQFHLMKLFSDFIGAAQDKHEDQFIARAAEEPAKPTARLPARGIAKMSGSRTQDGSSQPTSATAPLYAAPSPVVKPSSPSPPDIPFGSPSASTDDPSPALSTGVRTLRKKRKPEDAQAHDRPSPVAVEDNGNNEGPSSSSKKNQKRQRKTRS